MPASPIDRLRFWFDACPQAAIAFSGGVDSAVVAYLARHFLGHERCRAWIADSASLKRADLAEAKAFAQDHDLPLQILATQELANPDYAANPVDRCYHCKNTLFQDLLERVDRDTWILSGANHDDRGDYRPGMQAAAEAQVRAPLLECGIGKDGVRALARHFRLSCADKPASPCLSSRIPYGQAVTAEKLARIEAAEAWLQQRGFPVCRVRYDQNTARIEVPAEQLASLLPLQDGLAQACRKLGFDRIDIDQEGFVSGKLNRGIAS